MSDKQNLTRRTDKIGRLEAAYILGMADGGALPSQIASRVERDTNTIIRVLQRHGYKSKGVSKSSDRPQKTTKRDNKLIVRKATVNCRGNTIHLAPLSSTPR